MIVVTHEMGFAREVCDRVVFMDPASWSRRARRERCWSSRRRNGRGLSCRRVKHEQEAELRREEESVRAVDV